MVKVEFNLSNNYSFRVTGHAEAGPYGQDLVCAAVTGIVSGMLNVLDARYGDEVAIVVNENEIKINANTSSQEMFQDLETLLLQLQTLELQYPKNINIKEVH
jgi:uncharacterized protein YsxB (DUF464 family)